MGGFYKRSGMIVLRNLIMKTISPQQSVSHLNCPGFKGTLSFSYVPEIRENKADARFQVNFEGITDSCETNERLTTPMKQTIDELSRGKHSDKMRRLFQISKLLEFVILQVRENEARVSLKTVKSYDIGKLQEAKSIVENNLANPYSLKNLAHKVGLNDFKLKKGFKELFGFTVFGYLRELRMLKARKLLLAEKDTVTCVSGEVGYQHPHHFSTAFKKRFGILPGTLIK